MLCMIPLLLMLTLEVLQLLPADAQLVGGAALETTTAARALVELERLLIRN